MQTPPPYGAQFGPPPKKSNQLSYILIGVSLVCIGLCGVGGYFAWQQAKGVIDTGMTMVGCTADLKVIRDSLVAYANEKGAFPKAETWQDDIRDKVTAGVAASNKEFEEAPFKISRIDPNGEWNCVVKDSTGKEIKYGFAYNSEVAGKKMAEIKDPATMVLVFESDKTGKNLAMKYALPPGKPEPKFMNQPREWLKAMVSGDVDFDFEGGSAKGSASSK